MYWANAQNLPELPPVSCHGRLPLEGCKPRGPERDPPAPSCPVQGFPSTLPRKVCPTGPQGGTPQGGFRVAWRGRPTSSWETRGTSVVGLGVGSGRGWWSAGDSRFPPPSHRVSAHRAKGAEAAHWTPGCCSCLLTPLPWRPPGRPSRPRAFVLAVPPPRSPLLGPGLSLPPCPLVGSTSAGLLGRPAPALRPIPASPVCRLGGGVWVGAFVLPVGPRVEIRVLSWAVSQCPGPTSHTEAWFRPRGKAWSWPWGPGKPNSCWWETPVCPHTLLAPGPCPCRPGSGARQRQLCRVGRAECERGRQGLAARGRQGPFPGPREPLGPGCGPRGRSGLPRGRGLHSSLFARMFRK